MKDPEERALAWQAWRMWQERCALGRCDRIEQELLRRVVGSRFRGCVRKCGGALGRRIEDSLSVEDADAWHLFETRLVTGHTRAGKSYKHWLFARAEGQGALAACDTVEAGATLLCREAAREYLRREAPRRIECSLQTPVGFTGGCTLGDLLPSPEAWADPAASVAAREIERRARGEAERIFDAAPFALRVGWVARTLDLAVSDPAVAAAAGVRKSRISGLLRQSVTRIGFDAMARHDPSDRETALAEALAIIRHLARMAISWGALEKSVRPLFGRNGRVPGEVRTGRAYA